MLGASNYRIRTRTLALVIRITQLLSLVEDLGTKILLVRIYSEIFASEQEFATPGRIVSRLTIIFTIITYSK
jgi:hypothetical protein